MATKIVRSKPLGNLLNKLIVPRFLTQKTKLTNFCKIRNIDNLNINNICKFSVNSVVLGSAGHAETTSTTQGLSKLQAQELILRLNGEERSVLMTALHEYQSKLVKDEYEGKMMQVSLRYLVRCVFFLHNTLLQQLAVHGMLWRRSFFILFLVYKVTLLIRLLDFFQSQFSQNSKNF